MPSFLYSHFWHSHISCCSNGGGKKNDQVHNGRIALLCARSSAAAHRYLASPRRYWVDRNCVNWALWTGGRLFCRIIEIADIKLPHHQVDHELDSLGGFCCCCVERYRWWNAFLVGSPSIKQQRQTAREQNGLFIWMEQLTSAPTVVASTVELNHERCPSRLALLVKKGVDHMLLCIVYLLLTTYKQARLVILCNPCP